MRIRDHISPETRQLALVLLAVGVAANILYWKAGDDVVDKAWFDTTATILAMIAVIRLMVVAGGSNTGASLFDALVAAGAFGMALIAARVGGGPIELAALFCGLALAAGLTMATDQEVHPLAASVVIVVAGLLSFNLLA